MIGSLDALEGIGLCLPGEVLADDARRRAALAVDKVGSD
jgi:hypothetical protein